MARKVKTSDFPRGIILLVDDDHEYNEATKQLLSSEGFEVASVFSGEEALESIEKDHFDLVLLDYRMPGLNGAQVVRELRKTNKHVQIVLQTGYATEKPPRDLLRELDIQGYFEKGDGVDRLLLWVEAGIKAARATDRILYHREGLKKVLDAATELHTLTNKEDALIEAAKLGAEIAALSPNGKNREAGVQLTIVNSGKPEKSASWPQDHELSAELAELASRACKDGPAQADDSSLNLPLRAGEECLGVLSAKAAGLGLEEADILALYAVQVAVAIRNRQLYSMATTDPLTSVYVRRFYDQWMVNELRTAFRQGTFLSFLLIDLDNMKVINDTHGHNAGDAALAWAGKILKHASRSTDFAARYGGDEFALILPSTNSEGANVVADKILKYVKEEACYYKNVDLKLTLSIGITTLIPQPEIGNFKTPHEYFENMAQLIVARADHELYKVKRIGKGKASSDGGQHWPGL